MSICTCEILSQFFNIFKLYLFCILHNRFICTYVPKHRHKNGCICSSKISWKGGGGWSPAIGSPRNIYELSRGTHWSKQLWQTKAMSDASKANRAHAKNREKCEDKRYRLPRRKPAFFWARSRYLDCARHNPVWTALMPMSPPSPGGHVVLRPLSWVLGSGIRKKGTNGWVLETRRASLQFPQDHPSARHFSDTCLVVSSVLARVCKFAVENDLPLGFCGEDGI
jgi:hypothetical protein